MFPTETETIWNYIRQEPENTDTVASRGGGTENPTDFLLAHNHKLNPSWAPPHSYVASEHDANSYEIASEHDETSAPLHIVFRDSGSS